jgi:putative ABC transport system substrate-binding protein
MTEGLRRRAVFGLAFSAVLAPALAANAAGEPTKVLRLGMIVPSRPLPGTRAFEEQLGEFGYEEGRNLQLDFLQLFGSDIGHVPEMAAELVGRGVDAILAGGPELALKSVMAATRTVPIVMVAIDYDPLAGGYIASLARPGGNVTGVFFQQVELTAKRLELLAETVPGLARVVVMWDRITRDQFETARAAARSLKIPADGIECADPPYDYERALSGVDGARRDVLLQTSSPFFMADRQRLAELALDHRLPSMFAFREWADVGGLMSYGPSLTGMYRLAARYVDRIARGAKPTDLPVEQPTRFELVVNMKSAAALGLTIPPSILARADEVIE